MDPDMTLFRMLQLANRMVGDGTPESDDAAELAELVLALDGWMGGGGFKPTPWAGPSCIHCTPRKGK